jgi:hypothetical protein
MQIDPPEIFAPQPSGIIQFEAVHLYRRPVDIRLLMDALNFAPANKKKWGAIFQGGCLKIAKDDYNLIERHSKH